MSRQREAEGIGAARSFYQWFLRIVFEHFYAVAAGPNYSELDVRSQHNVYVCMLAGKFIVHARILTERRSAHIRKLPKTSARIYA
jgi:hypothetical protein